jgi:HlyD family secretion protein
MIGMRTPRTRTIVLLTAPVVLVGVLAVLFAPEPITVESSRVTRGPMTVTVASEGKTRVKDLYEVAAPLGGRLLRIAIRAGDKVVANDTLIGTIEPPQPQFHDARSRAELEAKARAAEALHALAEADLVRAQADLEFARAEVVRKKNLSTTGAESQRSYEQAERDLKIRDAALVVAEKTIKQRKSEMESAKASLMTPGHNGRGETEAWIEIRSPVSGRVLNVLKESETIVAAGMPLIQVGDPAKLEVMLEMLSEDAVKVREGASARLEGWGGERLNGRVRRVEPFGFTKVSALGVEEQRVRVLLDFTDPVEAWRALGHGYRINAKIVIWEGANVVKLPIGALFRHGSNWATYVVRGGITELRMLTVGHLNDTEAEILNGVTEGEIVILHPSDRVTAGIPVRARGA